MLHTSPISLRRDVELTSLEPEHAAAMFRWVSDPQISQSIGLTREPSLDKTRQWIDATRDDPRMRPFAILAAGRHVGNVVLDCIERGLGIARLSIYIGESNVRSKGVGTTATYQALRQAFGQLELHKVWLTVHSQNFPAISVYSRIGFVLEGIHRDEFLMEGRRLPALYMGLLKTEFLALATVTHALSGTGDGQP